MRSLSTDETKNILTNKEGYTTIMIGKKNSKDDIPPNKNNSSARRKITGLSLSLVASVIFVVNGILVQYFALNAVDTVGIRSIFQVVFLGIFMKIKG